MFAYIYRRMYIYVDTCDTNIILIIYQLVGAFKDVGEPLCGWLVGMIQVLNATWKLTWKLMGLGVKWGNHF